MKVCRKSHQYEAFHKQCPICSKNWFDANKERRKEQYKDSNAVRSAAWDLANIDYKRERQKIYYRNNKTSSYFNSYKYNAAKKVATPKWITNKQLEEIAGYYYLAKNMSAFANETITVDHIIPFQGKSVCGMHVPWNLRIIPKSENCSKGNKLLCT